MNKKRLLVVAISLLLSGCGAAILAGGIAGSAIINDSRSFETMENDTRLSHDLGIALTRRKTLKTSHIVVSSFNQMIFLGGEVPNPYLKNLAERIVLKHPKVKRVYNEIKVGPNATMKEMAIDAWVTSNVKAMMLTRGGLRSGSFKVITERGVVYIMGYVSHEQANLAVDVARRVEHVKKVVRLFKYTD